MIDNSGDQRRPRRCVAAGMSLVAMALAAAGCSAGQDPAVNETAASDVAPDENPSRISPVAPVAPVRRAEFLAAAAAAADEVAGGMPLPKANLELTDRTFELRLAFGCGGSNSADWGQWSIDPETRVLRISVRPQVWSEDPMMKALAAGAPFDAAEGFWIERPWTRSEECPPFNPAGPTPSPSLPDDQPTTTPDAPVAHTLALIQYFSPDAPRTLRRGSRPYAYIGKVPETASLDRKGFRLKLVGRLRGFGDGQPIHCVSSTPMRPPICAAAVEFTQVVLEDAETGESLADWNS